MASIAHPSTIFSSIPSPTVKATRSISDPTQHCISFLKSCSNTKEFLPIHAHLITTNLIQDPLIASLILQFFVSIENVDYARLIFSQQCMPETKVWNTLLENQLQDQDGWPKQVFLTYYQMVSQGIMLDITTFHFLLHACCKDFDILQASEVQGRILKSGFGISRSLNNNLMGMYSKDGRLKEVRQLFENFPDRDVITWNTMISCYVRLGLFTEALDLFGKMLADGIKPDEITMISLVSACSKLRDLKMGESLHLYAEENGLDTSGSLLNCLVDMYIKCGEMRKAFKLLGSCESETTDVVLWTTLISGFVKVGDLTAARHLFNQTRKKNLITWATMISGYVQGGFYSKSLELFREMRLENVRPDEVALLTVISACAHMEYIILGRSIHGLVVKYGMIIDGFLGNSLIDLYSKCKLLDLANKVLEQLPGKNVVSWNSMLDGYCRSGEIEKARIFFEKMPEKDEVSWNTMMNCYTKFHLFEELFDLFREMQGSKVKPNSLTLVSLLSSCASVGALNHGIWVHAHIKRNQIAVDNKLATALVNMYGKCGSIHKAKEVFSEIKAKTVFLWTAMIAAHAMEGQPHKAIALYMEMEVSGIKPDHITFIALLSACSHGGLVDEGYRYFNKMRTVYNLKPAVQHYGCMVDLLGRVGRLEDAKEFIETMPIEPDASIWSSLMRACATYHKVKLAEHAFERIIKMDPSNASAYVLLSNIYAKAKRWEDMSWVRRKMKEIGVQKQLGCSLIEHNGTVHKFTSGDFSDTKYAEIYSMLDEIEGQKGRLHEEEEAAPSSQHSEKLAVAFGLITTPTRTPIRIVNNLRMCSDCHSDMKMISRAYDREIVLRENFRFHRFQHGSCSCNGHW
ncbi:hypothetical protein RJ640_022588 [Escallonia rubra]|uniref:DYW domain-containing protein n=1 Tax=Escallonia rubra TaxID=112253 RepID=A0AA88UIA3_9ASTE|nr:hypothetical protein RJ640_022588 [Escallonia rubra]